MTRPNGPRPGSGIWSTPWYVRLSGGPRSGTPSSSRCARRRTSSCMTGRLPGGVVTRWAKGESAIEELLAADQLQSVRGAQADGSPLLGRARNTIDSAASISG